MRGALGGGGRRWRTLRLHTHTRTHTGGGGAQRLHASGMRVPADQAVRRRSLRRRIMWPPWLPLRATGFFRRWSAHCMSPHGCRACACHLPHPSANTLAKMANGLCDNLVTCVVRCGWHAARVFALVQARGRCWQRTTPLRTWPAGGLQPAVQACPLVPPPLAPPPAACRPAAQGQRTHALLLPLPLQRAPPNPAPARSPRAAGRGTLASRCCWRLR